MRNINFPDYPNITVQPAGLSDISHRVYFSTGLNGYIEEFLGSLTFTGEAYNVFRQLLFTGQCSLVSAVLTDYSGNPHECNIFLNDAKWYPLKRCVECEVVPRGYLSQIDNNSSIKIFLNVPQSKNGGTITAATATGLTYVLNDGTTWVTDRVGVWVIDALKTLVSFMTDGTTSVVSEYFTTSDLQPLLIKGSEIRVGGAAAEPANGAHFPQISFADLMDDLSKLFCVIFSTVDGESVLRIEPRGYFNQSAVGPTINAPDGDNIYQESDPSSFFAKMMFGGEFSSDYDYLPQLRFMGFDTEEYFVGIECNNKSELDLRPRNVIVDTNIIQQVINDGATATGNNDHDDDIFMIYHYVSSGLPDLAPHPVIAGDVYYNRYLSNYETALRWFGQVPYNIYSFFGFGNNEARRWRTQEYLPNYVPFSFFQAGLIQFPLTNPPFGYDPNSNMSDIAGSYEISTSGSFATDTPTFYVAPISAVYTTHIDIYWLGDAGDLRDFFIIKYDVADNFLNMYPIGGPSEEIFQGVQRVQGSASIDAQATDKFCVLIVSSLTSPIGFESSFNSMFWVDDPFTVSQTFDETQTYVLETTVEVPLSDEQWKSITDLPHGTITINTRDGVILGHVNDAKRNSTNQQATIVLRSKLSDTNV